MVEELAGDATGGVPITSYQIDYDKATNGAEWEELKGFASNDLELHATKAGLTLNTAYRARYRAKNIYGWGEYSESAVILTIQEPARPDPVETQVVSSNVRVTWSEPESFGSAITHYEA